jgi:PEP-CTERM motif
MFSSMKHTVALTFFIALLFAAVMNRDIVPEPAALLMLGTGLVGMASMMRRNLSNREDSAKE